MYDNLFMPNLIGRMFDVYARVVVVKHQPMEDMSTDKYSKKMKPDRGMDFPYMHARPHIFLHSICIMRTLAQKTYF